MSRGFKAGSVTGEIALDTTQFDNAIKKLKEEVRSLKTDFGSLESTNGVLVEVIEELKTELKSLTSENDNSKKTVKELVKTNDKLKDSLRQIKEEYAEVSSKLTEEQHENKILTQQLEKVALATDNVVKENEKLKASLKETEAQSKKTAASLQQDFTKSFNSLVKNAMKGTNNNLIELKPIYNQLKKQFKGLVSSRAEFEHLFTGAMAENSLALKAARTNTTGVENIKFKIGGSEIGFGYIDVSNLKQATSASKELSEETNKVAESTKKATEAVKEEATQIKEEGETAKKAAEETIQANNEKVSSNEKVKKSVKETSAELKKTNKETTQTGKSVQKTLDMFASSGEKTVKSAKTVNNSYKNLGDTAKKVSAALDTLQKHNAKAAAKQVQDNDKVTASLKKEEVQAKKTATSVSKFTADETKLLKDMYEHFTYRKDLGDTKSPFAVNYRWFEETYKDLFTKLDTTNPNMANRIKKQFMRKFQKFSNMLGVDLVQGAFEGVLADGTPRYTNFLGHRVGSYDLSNLISEEEFKKLIGELEEVEVEEKKVTEEAVKIKETFSEVNSSVIESSKKAVEAVKELQTQSTKTASEETQSNKKVANSYNEIAANAKKAVSSLKSVQDDWYILGGSTTKIDKTTGAVKKLNKEISRTAAQSKKLEADAFTAVTTEISKYMANLGRGRKNNLRGLLDSNKAVWREFEGMEVRMFDYNRLREHLSKTFKGLLTDSELNRAMVDVFDHFGLGELPHNVEGLGGITRENLEKLNIHSSAFEMTLEKLANKIRQVIAETSGMKETFSEPIATTTIDNASKALEFLKDEGVKTEEEIKKLKQTLNELSNSEISPKSTEQALSALEQYLNIWAEAPIEVKRSAEEIENAIRQFASIDYVGKEGTKFDNFGRNFLKIAENAKKANEALKQVSETTKVEISHFERLVRTARAAGLGLMNLQRGAAVTSIAQEQFNQSLNKSIYNAEKYKERLSKIASELTAKWHSMSVELAKANAAQYKYWQQSRGSVSGYGEPLPIKGYNDYLKAIKEINQGLAEFKRKQQEVNKVAKYTDDNFKVAGQALARMNTELEKEVRTIKLANRQLQLWHKYHRIDRGTYISNMGEINAKLEQQTSNLKKSNSELGRYTLNARQAGNGLTSFNNGVVQTAHSGRILSNTLYQIRGALLSLKMIFTAMGGMMLWGFAMDMAESVKETVTAKNEMEAQLKQRFTNKKGQTDWASIQYVQKALDRLPNTFKKVNKYAIGETVSSIGLEFDLTAKQMKEALPIVTMVSSEYVRAGRKEEEAALAVKDILQGEFQRLSRETGIGKEELIAYGWDENKENIDGLLKAIQKAALDRHWDTFAKKATSLNDVLTITKSRFSELGAEIIDSITPMIVGGFNSLIDMFTGLQSAFDNMNSFWKNFTVFGGTTGIIGGLLTALPMITKQMGLAQIATIGWRKSVLTAALNLNKFEVAQYGLGKAIAAVVTGTKASEIATMRTSKAIMGRILGVKQATLSEHGYLAALVKSKMELKNGITIFNDSGIAAMNLRQKIIYLTKGELVANKAGATYGKTLKSLITSTKLWGIAIKGIMAIGLITWFASIATWADSVKKRFEKYNTVLAEGKDEIKSMQDQIDTYDKKLAGMSKSDKNYGIYTQNKETLEHNKASMELAYKLAKKIKKENKENEELHKSWITGGLDTSYEKAGLKYTLQRTNTYQQMKYLRYDIKKSEEEAYNFEYASLQHINEKVGLMKQDADIQAKQITNEKERAKFEKDAQDKRVKYITDYSIKAEEAAKHLKEFNQGDFTAGIYYVMDRITLLWIDLWNNDHFTNFWISVKKTWEDLKPTAYAIKDALQGIAEVMMDFFATDSGRWIGAIGLLGTTLGVVGIKTAKWVTGAKTSWDILKGLGGTLKDRIKDWKGLGKSAEEAGEKVEETTGGGTGGSKLPSNRSEWWADTKGKLFGDLTTYARSAVAIAAGMLLISEAIYMLQAPMYSLAETGKYFKSREAEIREGVDGLKLISPVMLALLPPVIALSLIFDHYAPDFTRIVEGTAKAGVGIAMGMLLVAETIAMVIPSLWALGMVGEQYKGVKSQVKKGVEAIKVVSESLQYLVPFVPVLAGAIAITVACFAAPEVGLLIAAGVTLGIPAGMLWIAETIGSLQYPLNQIALLGKNYKDLGDVKQGAEAIKITAEALGYVEEGMRAFVAIKFEELASLISDIIGKDIGVDLTQLSGEGGFFDQLKNFTEQFNKLELTPIDTDKVTTLSNSATGLDSVKTALVTVKEALKDLPDFNQDNRSINQKYQDNVSGSTTTEGITNYFEQLKQPIEQLNEFINNFNDLELVGVEESQVEIIQNSANAIGAINTAIDTVKTAIGNAVDTQWNANMATGGILGAAAGLLFGDGNPAASSIKGGLDELYYSVKDIMDFNTKIAGLTSEGSGDTSSIEGASNMVSALQTEINNLNTTLSTAVPTIQSTAKNMGTAIVTGVKEGLSTLSTVANDAKTQGENIATKLNDGFKDKIDLKSPTETEITNTLDYLGGKETDFYDKGKALGDALSRGYKEGQDIHSPGIIARSTQEELGRVEEYLSNAQINLPQLAFNLGNAISSNFKFDFGLGNIQLPNLSQFTDSLGTIVPTVNGIRDNVSTDFTTIQTNVGNSFNTIIGKTRTSLANMQGHTTKNIGAIRTSWKGMQTALIASAENIRSQTGQKINSLRNNMADFWKKIQNPSQLISGHIGSAGGNHRGTRPVRYGGSSALKGLFAGGTSSKAPNIDTDLKKYLECMMTTGGNCYAGGWNFNWNRPIQSSFMKWNTHFGKYRIDDFIKVGSFNNNTFPVKGIAEIAKAYIFDVISQTDYDKYFNSKFGEDPVSALMAGAFNCWDGTNVVLAIARAFGFEGSREHGTWNGIGHVWANIAGLGIIDPTAIQQNRAFKSPSVKGYSAGGTRTRNRSSGGDMPIGNTYNTTIEINVNGSDVEVNDKKISKESGKQILDILGINPATGR